MGFCFSRWLWLWWIEWRWCEKTTTTIIMFVFTSIRYSRSKYFQCVCAMGWRREKFDDVGGGGRANFMGRRNAVSLFLLLLLFDMEIFQRCTFEILKCTYLCTVSLINASFLHQSIVHPIKTFHLQCWLSFILLKLRKLLLKNYIIIYGSGWTYFDIKWQHQICFSMMTNIS